MTQHRAIYKSTSVEALDRFYREDVPGAVDLARDWLEDPDDELFAVAESWAESAEFEGDVQGFRTHWLDEDSALSAHDVDRVLRFAYRRALDLASSRGDAVPVETFWIRGAGDDFEVHIHDGVDRITMFMLIPVVRRYGSRHGDTRSFVVRIGDLDDVHPAAPREILDESDDRQPVYMVQVSGRYPGSEPEEA